MNHTQLLLGALIVLNAALVAQKPGRQITVTPYAGTAPSVTTQPANATVKLGATATFSVVASGTTPMTYQWYKWGNPISGATASKYTTPAVADSDNNAGFFVTIHNSAGGTTSNTAYLTVVDPPVITEQPHSLTVTPPAIATFTVYARGSWPMKFQWYKNGTAISGATDYTYSTTETTTADNGAKFTVIVSNAAAKVASAAAILTVNPFTKTGTYPLVGQWSGTATASDPTGNKQTIQVVAGFWQTSYSITGTIVFVDDNGIPEMGTGIASLNNLNLFTVVTDDNGMPMNLAAAFASNLLKLTGDAIDADGTGGTGSLILSLDHNTLTGSAAATDGSKVSWSLKRTK